MIICAAGDFHARETNPENRIDKDYSQTLIDKFWSVIEIICKESNKKKSILVLPGDVCDSFRISDRLKSILIDNFLQAKDLYGVQILAVAGQHDQRFHSTETNNTPLQVLAAAKALTIVDNKGILINDKKKRIMLYGCGWGDEDKIIQPFNSDLSFLIVHKMISNKDFWNGHVDYTSASKFLGDNEFDFIISGDNHNAFLVDHGNKILINCGSWARARIDQIDHRPVVFTLNTDTEKLLKHYIPVLPVDQVLRTSQNAQKRGLNDDLEVFSQALDGSFNSESEDLDFIKKLRTIADKTNIDKEVENIIFEAVKKATGEK